MKIRQILGIIFVLLLSSLTLAQSGIELDEPVWDLGNVPKGEVIEKTFKIKNTGSDRLVIKKVQASCECISLYILKSEAEKNRFAEIKAIFDTTKITENRFTKYIYVQSNDPINPVVRVYVKGVLGNKADKIEVSLFYSLGCRECRKVKAFISKLAERHKDNLECRWYDIDILENYLRLMELEERFVVTENNPIIAFAGNKYFSGKKAILNGIEPYIIQLIQTGTVNVNLPKNLNKDRLVEKIMSFSPFIILSAGFIDGLNPCAFVTVVFLISFLCLAGKNRREILFTGLVFSSGVFIAYLLLGIGLREILHRLPPFSLVSDFIHILIMSMVFILAFYNLYDAFIYLKSREGKNMKLKLPGLIINKIHSIIRNSFQFKRAMVIIFISGFMISLLESVCTGQVYLPTIIFINREPSMKNLSYLYLLLYNLAFIIPLLAVILLIFLGVSFNKLISLSRVNTFIAKLLLAGLFFILGCALLLAELYST